MPSAQIASRAITSSPSAEPGRERAAGADADRAARAQLDQLGEHDRRRRPAHAGRLDRQRPAVGGRAGVAPQAAVVVEHPRLARAAPAPAPARARGRRAAARARRAARSGAGGAARRVTSAATLDSAAMGDARRARGSLSGRAARMIPSSEPGELTLAQVAARAGVSPATVRRWVQQGPRPRLRGRWTPAAAAYVRVVARLRARGHSLEQIKQASDNGQLRGRADREPAAAAPGRGYTLRQAARAAAAWTPALIERILTRDGPRRAARATRSPRRTCEMLRYAAAVLEAGLPLEAFLQLMRVYGAGDRADRRRRGAPDPPLRARAADARGRLERRDRRGDGGPDARAAAVRGAAA